MRTMLRSKLLSWLVSAREQRLRRGVADLKRRLSGGRHGLRCFLELDDPYSYLLAWYIPALRECFDIRIEFYLVQALVDGYRPRPDLYAEYALQDCGRLASELGVPFLDKGSLPPVEHRRAALDYLAKRQGSADSDEELLQVLQHYWRGDAENIARRVAGHGESEQAERLLIRNSELLEKLGHFSAASVRYGGEWFTGIDRLHYLVARLQAAGAGKSADLDSRLVSLLRATQLDLPVAPPGAARQLFVSESILLCRAPQSAAGSGQFRAADSIADGFADGYAWHASAEKQDHLFLAGFRQRGAPARHANGPGCRSRRQRRRTLPRRVRLC